MKQNMDRIIQAIWSPGGVLLFTVACLGVAHSELNRVQRGDLFAFALPGETPADSVEIEDAQQSAQEYWLPAILFLTAIGAVAALASRKATNGGRPYYRPSHTWWFVCGLFMFAVLADLVSTIWFFHAHGVQIELHPAVRLFGYAYGRTIGPLLAKLIQAGGVLAVAYWLKSKGVPWMALVTAIYLGAAIYNISQM